MEQQAARNLVERVFNSPYSNENYIELISNILKSYDRDFREINLSNDQKIFSKFNFLGSYDANGDLVGIYEVELSNSNALNRARVAQRNLIANQLKNSNHSSALVSYFVENTNEWRFSYVKSELLIDDSSERLKFIEELTPARRQSFIAGPNEGTHTAKKQILPSLYSDDYPKLKDIEQIFQIEPVNDDFYDQYKELFLRLAEYLEESIRKDEVIAKDFEDKEVLPSDFAKKTLGQFVFLYFIQRKGWIKNKDNPSNIFSFNKLFDTRQSYGDNFFNDVMEPIFYESLAKEDPNYDLYPVLKSFDFPYLNGGLFEPIRGYDWEQTNLHIPDTFFKNENKTKDGDFGDGLLDIFNRFNFTVYENDSLEQDIAVDPEMLGKVFEKLLPVKSRKDSGSFYTPKEVVEYMCQESLINYLTTEIGDDIPEDILKFFIINNGILQHDKINDSELSLIKEKAFDLDSLLASIKVCDPAIGSGAFPMGMLNEIISARSFLQEFLLNKKTIYDLKIHTIGQSLYGVDIDPSAIDIARLRFWLSLIIEKDVPSPLPNLDHKLMQGNSLLTKYQGVELFNDQFLVNADNRQEKINMIDEELNLLEKELIEGISTNLITQVKAIKSRLIKLNKKKNEIQKENSNTPVTEMLFESNDVVSRIKKQVSLLQSKISNYLLPIGKENKIELKKEIDELKWNLIEASIDNESQAKLFNQLKNKRIQPFFLWKLEFIDVFRNDGFDIVIGNPPYIMEYENKEAFVGLDSHPCYQGKTDIWHLFTGTGLSLLKEKGFLTFIAKNQWLCSASAAKMREEIYTNSNVMSIVDFGANLIFDSADQQTMILTLQKNNNNKNHQIKYIKFDGIFKLNNLFQNLLDRSFNSDQLFVANKSIPKNFDKNENLTFPSNKNELILNKIFAKSNFELDSKNEIIQGIIGGPDKAFILDKKDLDHFNESEKNFIKMFHTNTSRFFTPDSSKYIFYLNKINTKNIDIYPNLKNKLTKYKEVLLERREVKKNRIDWFHLWWPRDESFFLKGPKIIFTSRTKKGVFSYSEENFYGSRNLFFIKTNRINLKYLTAFLNSSLVYFYMNERLKHTGDLLQLDKNQFIKIPIFVPENTNKFESIVDQIIESKQKDLDTTYAEKQIDKLVYALYQLTDEEIDFIENNQ